MLSSLLISHSIIMEKSCKLLSVLAQSLISIICMCIYIRDLYAGDNFETFLLFTVLCSKFFLIPDSFYICCSGVYYPRRDGIECCGTNYYEPGPEICCDNSHWYNTIDPDTGRTAVCCGETYYVPHFEICCGGGYYDKSIYDCCAGSPFRKADQCCNGGNVLPAGFCGCVETSTRVCCNETPYSRRNGYACCGSRYLPTSTYICCGNRPYPTQFGYACCGGVNEYIPAEDECCANGRVVARPATCANTPPCTPGGGGHVYYRK